MIFRNQTYIRMKQFSIFAFILLAITGCSQEEIDSYDTSLTALNIWVGTEAGAVYESVDYNYSYAYEEGSITFYAQLVGVPVDYDRTFRLEAFSGDSAQVVPTIRTMDYVIPAGATQGTYKVYFNSQRLPDANLFTDTDGSISFRVVPSSQFAVGTENHQQFTVVLRNYLAKPSNWDTANYPRVPLSKYFGTYSQVKYKFMIEHLGLIDFEINYNAQTSYDETTNVISVAYAIYLQQVMQRALNDYNNSHEVPLTDEFGLPVTF